MDPALFHLFPLYFRHFTSYIDIYIVHCTVCTYARDPCTCRPEFTPIAVGPLTAISTHPTLNPPFPLRPPSACTSASLHLLPSSTQSHSRRLHFEPPHLVPIRCQFSHPRFRRLQPWLLSLSAAVGLLFPALDGRVRVLADGLFSPRPHNISLEHHPCLTTCCEAKCSCSIVDWGKGRRDSERTGPVRA